MAVISKFSSANSYGYVSTGTNIMIMGLIISGSGSLPITFTPAGSTAFGSGGLPSVTLNLYNGFNVLVSTTTNEAPLSFTFTPGNWTIKVLSGTNGQGVAALSAVQTDMNASARWDQVSIRGITRPDSYTTLFLNFTATTLPSLNRYIVRSIGPTMTENGVPVPGRITDPTLYLYNDTGTLLDANNNYGTYPGVTGLSAYTSSLGPTESIVAATLTPGKYTAIAPPNGAYVPGATSGLGLIEVYGNT